MLKRKYCSQTPQMTRLVLSIAQRLENDNISSVEVPLKYSKSYFKMQLWNSKIFRPNVYLTLINHRLLRNLSSCKKFKIKSNRTLSFKIFYDKLNQRCWNEPDPLEFLAPPSKNFLLHLYRGALFPSMLILPCFGPKSFYNMPLSKNLLS